MLNIGSKKKKKGTQKKQETPQALYIWLVPVIRWAVLSETLFVANKAIELNIKDPIIWASLTAIAGYAALTKNNIPGY
jgi:hypothetical protein